MRAIYIQEELEVYSNGKTKTISLNNISKKEFLKEMLFYKTYNKTFHVEETSCRHKKVFVHTCWCFEIDGFENMHYLKLHEFRNI